MKNYIFISIGLFIFGLWACETAQTTEQKAMSLLPYLQQTTTRDTVKPTISHQQTQVKPPSINPRNNPPSYEIYTWRRSKDGSKIIILGKNLFSVKKLFVGTEEIDLTPSQDGKETIGTYPETQQDRPMYLEVADEIVQMKEYFTSKEEIPQVNKCRFSYDNSLVPDCQINDAEQYVRFDCEVQGYQSYTGYVTAHIGNVVIPNSQLTFQDNSSVISGYISLSQLGNVDEELPFSVDFGNGLRAISLSSFILP